MGRRSITRRHEPKFTAKRQTPWAAVFSPAFIKDNGQLIFRALVIIITGFWIVSPALHGDWLWDDIIYFSKNPVLLDPHRVWKAWFEPGSFVEYYPLEETVQWIQWQLWHEDTFGYHLTNVILHIVNALLVWRLLGRLGLKLAWLGGLIFVIHPTAVESVAAIAELKNTLSLTPFLLAVCAWIDYQESKKGVSYWWALGLFLAAMFCKITMAPFPVVMLLYAWWKRGRITRGDILDSTPFFVISLALAATTIWAGGYYSVQQNLPPDVVHLHGVLERLDCAGLALAFYFSRCFLPVNPLPMYPQWPLHTDALWQFLPWPILAGAIAWMWFKRESWGRQGLLGLGWFVLFLVPFLGFTSVSYMKCTWVMDHFLYIPIIGVIGLITAALEDINRRISPRSQVRVGAMGALALVLGTMAWESHWYSGLFVSEESLFTHVLRHNPGAWAAHNNFGYVLTQQNRLPEAIEQFKIALSLEPEDAETRVNLGLALSQTGHVAEAQAQYEEALKLWPGSIRARVCLADDLRQSGRVQDALVQLQQAVELHPGSVTIRLLLGDAYVRMGQLPQALEQYAQASTLDPTSALAHYNCGVVLRQCGRLPEAIAQYKEAIRLNPGYAEAYNNLGAALYMSGYLSDAIREYQHALSIKPNFPEAQENLVRLQQLQNATPQ